MRPELRFATYLAPCVRPAYQAIATEVGRRLGLTTDLVTGRSPRQIADGKVDLAFICSPPYLDLAAANPPAAHVVAAPVLTDPAFGGRPQYRSDVIVGAGSRFRSFADLRGASWAYNEPSSYSGYFAVRARLAAIGEPDGYFGTAVKAGWHEKAIRMVADGLVDASAIDCQVLSIVLAAEPELATRLRVIDSLGVAPIQPVVAGAHLDPKLLGRARSALLEVAADPAVAAVLAAAGLQKFVEVHDADYDPIRQLLERARGVRLARELEVSRAG